MPDVKKSAPYVLLQRVLLSDNKGMAVTLWN
jgi:hypothetical protein